MRRAWLAVPALLLLVPASVLAQDVPPPPPAYASASIGMDLVLEPLVSAAEADLGAGEITMALARTQVVLAEVPASSSVHVRAEGLSLLARQRLGTTPPGTVDAGAAYAPLVTTATADVAAGRVDLARARAQWLLAHVQSTSAIAVRAQGVIASIDQRAAAPSPIVVTAAGWRPPVESAPMPVESSRHRPRRRSDLEIVDLYITSGLAGAFFGAWITESSGAIDHSSSDDQSRIVSIAMLAGAGVLTLGTFALDQVDDGPRAGQPGAIAAGIRFGFVLSGLSLGLWSADHTTDTATSFDALGIGILGGATLGTIFAYVAEPHPSQVQFTQSVGVWGGVLGAELAALVAPLAFPNLGAGTERVQSGFGITLGGLSVGLLTGVVLSAAHENFSARRSWLTSLGLVAGTGAGTLVWLLVSAGSRWSFDFPTWGGIAGIGGLGGLILAAVLTDGDRSTRSWDDEPPVQLSIAPTVGGATLGVNGTF